MALRKIVTKEDPILRKVCRPVEKFDDKLAQLLDDMAQTLYKVQGYGLAAPQVGILRRIAVIDVGEGLLEVINPVITKTRGKQRDVEAQDRYGNFYEKDLKGMFCRCACHETDHLDGKLFLDLVEEFLEPEDE